MGPPGLSALRLKQLASNASAEVVLQLQQQLAAGVASVPHLRRLQLQQQLLAAGVTPEVAAAALAEADAAATVVGEEGEEGGPLPDAKRQRAAGAHASSSAATRPVSLRAVCTAARGLCPHVRVHRTRTGTTHGSPAHVYV